MPYLTATLFSYHLICSRKSWLHRHHIRMEQESETVALGRLLDENSYGRDKKQIQLEATTPDGIQLVGTIDRANLRKGFLHETKKGKACEEAHVWQVRFYLWLLTLNGVSRPGGKPFKGKLDYPTLRRTVDVILTSAHQQILLDRTNELNHILQQERSPPRIAQRNFCRKCAFEELCYG